MEWSDEDLRHNESIDEDNDSVTFTAEADDVNDATLMSLEESGTQHVETAFKRGRRQFITSRLVSALDNAKVSSGMAVHILIAAAEALGHRVEELVINRSTIHRLRQQNRQQESLEIQADFNENVILILFSMLSVKSF